MVLGEKEKRIHKLETQRTVSLKLTKEDCFFFVFLCAKKMCVGGGLCFENILSFFCVFVLFSVGVE